MMLTAGIPQVEDSDYRMIADNTLYSTSYDYVHTEAPWFGLFETDSGYELRQVELELIAGSPPLEDWERPSGSRVTVLNETDDWLILMSSSSTILTEGSVSTAPLEYSLITPDSTVLLAAPDLPEYRLFATKEGLFLSDDETSQLITDTPPGGSYSNIYIAIVWAGDLDRDGIIDLIIDDVSDSYHYYCYSLYLSSEAESDCIVRLVSSFYDVYY